MEFLKIYSLIGAARMTKSDFSLKAMFVMVLLTGRLSGLAVFNQDSVRSVTSVGRPAAAYSLAVDHSRLNIQAFRCLDVHSEI